MPDCLSFNKFPEVLQHAAQRKPRQTSRTAQSGTRDATREPVLTTHSGPNNFLAEALAMHGESLSAPLGSRQRNASDAHGPASSARLRFQKAFVDRALTLRDAAIHPSGEHRCKTRHALCSTATNFRRTIILPKLELCTSASTNTPA